MVAGAGGGAGVGVLVSTCACGAPRAITTATNSFFSTHEFSISALLCRAPPSPLHFSLFTFDLQLIMHPRAPITHGTHLLATIAANNMWHR